MPVPYPCQTHPRVPGIKVKLDRFSTLTIPWMRLHRFLFLPFACARSQPRFPRTHKAREGITFLRYRRGCQKAARKLGHIQAVDTPPGQSPPPPTQMPGHRPGILSALSLSSQGIGVTVGGGVSEAMGGARGVHEGTMGVTDGYGVQTSVWRATSASVVGVVVTDGVMAIGVKAGSVPVGIGVQVYGSKVAVITGGVSVAAGSSVGVGEA